MSARRSAQMGIKMQFIKQHKKICGVSLIALVILVFFFCYYFATAEQRDDYKRIANEEYDTVFLSMYPVDTYREEDFLHYRGMSVLKTSHSISSPSMLSRYLKRIARSGNVISTMYLGIRPDLITMEELQDILLQYPSVTFEVILAYPDEAYWAELSQTDYEKLLDSYSRFLDAVPLAAYGNFYFWAATEWLVENPGNYEDHFLLNTDIARTVMLNSDMDHGYNVTVENAAVLSDALTANTLAYRNGTAAYPDLSDCDIVLFGDSVIGNYTDSASIPGVIHGLTGAAVYNCGYGGGQAAKLTGEGFALPDFVDAFFAGSPGSLPEDKPIYEGILSYAADAHEGRKQVFIINFGINDYYVGNPVRSSDAYDAATFSGALRTAAASIQAHIPDAKIILCTPNFTFRFEYGEEPLGPDGEKFSDYADAVKAVASEMGLNVLDNFYDLGITPDNMSDYLEYDLVHPNAACRFIIGSRLALLIP